MNNGDEQETQEFLDVQAEQSFTLVNGVFGIQAGVTLFLNSSKEVCCQRGAPFSSEIQEYFHQNPILPVKILSD